MPRQGEVDPDPPWRDWSNHFRTEHGNERTRVVGIIARRGGTDAVFTNIAPGALRYVEPAGIRGWTGPADVPLPEVLERA